MVAFVIADFLLLTIKDTNRGISSAKLEFKTNFSFSAFIITYSTNVEMK